MIEYLVVLTFGIVVILQGGDQAPLRQLATAIKDYHKHYSYAMAIATIPDCDYQLAYDKSTNLGDIVSLTGGLTVGFDRCIDWTNPQIPTISITNFTGNIGLTDNVKGAISDMVTNMISSSIDSFVNPSGLLDDMLNFSPSDFF